MDTKASPGLPGMGLGRFGFSLNPVILCFSCTWITPKEQASLMGTGRAAMVTSARFLT